MLADRKITAEEAEKLLDKLGAPGADPGASEAQAADESASRAAKQRYLRIVVDSRGRDPVNIRVPLAFMRTGVRLMAVLPAQVNEKLAERGIDLSALAGMKGQELIDALQDLDLDVEARDGKKVRIYCE
jgi:hypothetical protein